MGSIRLFELVKQALVGQVGLSGVGQLMLGGVEEVLIKFGRSKFGWSQSGWPQNFAGESG